MNTHAKLCKAVCDGNLCKVQNILAESQNLLQHYQLNKSGDTILHVASRMGHLNIIRFLLESNNRCQNDVEMINMFGKRSLHEAAQSSQPHVIKYLIEQGAEIDPLKHADWTPLMLASTKTGENALLSIKVLLKYGAKLQLQNKDGWTALHIAVKHGDLHIVKTLLHSNMSAAKILSKNGRSVLHIAALNSCESILKYLLQIEETQSLIEHKDSCGLTPVMEAICAGSMESVKLLISCGSSLNQTDVMGMTVIHLAAQVGQVDILNFLINECGQGVNTVSLKDHMTPLHFATRSNQLECVKLLVSLQAEKSLKDFRNRTAIDYAVEHKYEEIKDYLSSG